MGFATIVSNCVAPNARRSAGWTIEYTRASGEERMLTGGVEGFSAGGCGDDAPGEEGSEAIVLRRMSTIPEKLRLSRVEESRGFGEPVIGGLGALVPYCMGVYGLGQCYC